MKLVYSKLARAITDGHSNFNKEEFEKWFIENLNVGSHAIMEYLLLKKKQKDKEAPSGTK